MAKTYKSVYAIIFFIFLFLVANNVEGNFFSILFKFPSLVCSLYIIFISFCKHYFIIYILSLQDMLFVELIMIAQKILRFESMSALMAYVN